MAAGAWILHTRFLDASLAASGLVEPEEYEHEAGAGGLIAPGAPRHWRLRAANLDRHAFANLRVWSEEGGDYAQGHFNIVWSYNLCTGQCGHA